MTEPPYNPFERVPTLQPALVQAAEFTRMIFGRVGIRVMRFVLAVEVEHGRLDEPFRTAASWPMNETDEAAKLAGEAREIFLVQHASSKDLTPEERARFRVEQVFTGDEVAAMLVEAGAADDDAGAHRWIDRWIDASS